MDGSFNHSDTPSMIVERIVERGADWADKEHAASLLEETRKSVRAQIAIKNFADAGSAAKAELVAEASPEYVEHVTAMVVARKVANLAKVQYEAGKTWIDLIRSQEASRRAEMQIR
jgi:hypothetical protein